MAPAKDQYSLPRLQLARLGSSLLYGTRAMLVCFLLKRTSGHWNSEGVGRNMFLATTDVEQPYKVNSQLHGSLLHYGRNEMNVESSPVLPSFLSGI